MKKSCIFASSNKNITNTMKNIYTEKPWWPSCHYDGRRKKYFLNKSMEEFESDKQKHFQRQQMRWITDNLEKSRFRKVKSDLIEEVIIKGVACVLHLLHYLAQRSNG